MEIKLMDPEAFKAFLAKIPGLPVDQKMMLYLKLRTAKSALKKKADAADAEYKLAMETIENFMLADADKTGVTGFNIAGVGTSYTAETAKISIADDSAFHAFVIAQNDLTFFEQRVGAKRVAAYTKETKLNPPGLNIFRERVMRVRKAGEKLED
jgi:hypothetical protein